MTSSGIELRIGNKYRVGRKIGSGSFGDIYLGKKSDLFVFCRFVFSHLFLLVDEVKLRNENARCDDDEKTPIASDARSESREKRANTTLTNLSAPQERTFKRTRRLESNWYVFFFLSRLLCLSFGRASTFDVWYMSVLPVFEEEMAAVRHVSSLERAIEHRERILRRSFC